MTVKTKNISDNLVFWASCTAYALLFLYVSAAYLPGGTRHFKYATPHIVGTLYPSKWDFYTGSATEPIYRMYTVQDNKLVSSDIQPFTGRFWFGLKRDGKVISSELEEIATDTPFVASAIKYIVKMPLNGDLNNYIHPDTIKYNTYHSVNVRYLKGSLLLSIEDCPTWQQQRTSPAVQHNITLIPINLTAP